MSTSGLASTLSLVGSSSLLYCLINVLLDRRMQLIATGMCNITCSTSKWR